MEAYGSENYKTGDWGQIGYTAPGTKGSSSGEYSSTEFGYTGKDGTWNAVAKHKLDECLASSDGWKLTATVKSEGDAAAGEVHTADGGSASECTALTPAFAKLIK